MKSLCSLALLLTTGSSALPVELELEQGVIHGEADEQVEVYRGIPYAQPPVGELRWRPTVPLDTFDGLEQHIHKCHQGDENPGTIMIDEQEDCLTVNIFRPSDLREDEVLPILIYFHGGSHNYGSSHSPIYDGTILSSRYRQIVVAANFRIGIYGFMSFFRDGAPTGGNYGLLDQQQVIAFVRQNAISIQGDKSRITIFGESSGGESVAYHLINAKSSSMITNGIIESACYWWNSNPYSQTEQVNHIINDLCESIPDQCCTIEEEVTGTINSLRGCDGKVVFETYRNMSNSDPLKYLIFYPVTHDGVFFEEDARDIFNECKAPFDGSIIVGGNSFEGNLLYLVGNRTVNNFKPNEIRKVFASFATVFEPPALWQHEFIIEKYFNVYHEYFSYAPHWRFLESADAFMLSALIYGDFGFRRPSLEDSMQYQKCGSSVYSYYLDVETQWDPLAEQKLRYNGTGHAYEEMYTWAATELGTYPQFMNGLEPEQWEYDLTFLFQSQWSRLNHRGEPWIDWTTLGNDYNAFIIHQNKAKMESLLDQVMMDFWLNQYSSTWMIDQKAELTLRQGTVYGRKFPEQGVERFSGIPYAIPPVGERRWKPPQALNSFDDLNKKVVQHTTPCMQLIKNDYAIGEDCLVMDIYRPLSGGENLPVAIWIHGGALLYGAGSDSLYNMTKYAADGIISVSFNYRLHIFGFLSSFDETLDASVGGNYGMLDQQMAIKFVADNCDMIGCDPEQITIFGESAGGESVSWHTLSTGSTDLFQRAIVQSGAALFDLVPVQETPQVNENIRELHQVLYRDDDTSESKTMEQIISDLTIVEADKLLLAWQTIYLLDMDKHQGWSVVKNDGLFFTEDAREKWMTGNTDFKGTIVMGVNSFEGTLMETFTAADDWRYDDISFAYYLARGYIPVGEHQQAAITQMYMDAYKDVLENPDNPTSADYYLITSIIYGDLIFLPGNFFQAENYRHSDRRVYTYFIDIMPKVDLLLQKPARMDGLGHAGELNYVFNSPNTMMYEYYMKTSPYEWEYELADEIYNNWSSIMKNGAPSDKWTEMAGNYETYFIYESETKMKSATLEIKLLDFWLNEWSPDWQPTPAK